MGDVWYNKHMNDFYKQDVFFFITTIAVILLTVIFAVVLVYLIKILRDVKYISKKAKTEADIISSELSQFRENVKENGGKLKHFISFFGSVYKKSKK
jgi:type IV secretory pathway component VirB8